MALDTNVSCKEICRLCYDRFTETGTSIEDLTDGENRDTVIVSNGSRYIYFICNSAVKASIMRFWAIIWYLHILFGLRLGDTDGVTILITPFLFLVIYSKKPILG